MSITVLNKNNFSNTTAAVDEAAVKPLPNSRKIYVQGSNPDIQVPMREIRQTDTMTGNGTEKIRRYGFTTLPVLIPIRPQKSIFVPVFCPYAKNGSNLAKIPKSCQG